MNLQEAVEQWVRARYYLLRPWMHPEGPGEPVTHDLIVAEQVLHAALLETKPADEDDWAEQWKLRLEAARMAGARICPKDSVKPKKPKRRTRNLFG